MSFRNRCMVAGANGVQALTVPVAGGREQRETYRNIRIDHRSEWQKQHWRTLFSAYGKAPFFDHYAGELEGLFHRRDEFLVDWNLNVLEWLASKMKLELPRQLTELECRSMSPELDLSDQIRPSTYSHKVAGLECPGYPQVFQDRHGFLPNLSILDMLLCMGPAAGKLIRGNP